jgi:hypothetical protein
VVKNGVTTGISFFIISSIMTGDMVRFCRKPLDKESGVELAGLG